MTDEADIAQRVSPEMERVAGQKAKQRAKSASWDLDVAVFFLAILTTVVILLFQGVGLEVVAPAAIFGLAMGWLMGWKKAKMLYQRFYKEELSKMKAAPEKTIEETIEEKVQRALRERGR